MASRLEESCQEKMQALILEKRIELQLSWKHVAIQLGTMGLDIDDRVLANRINRGSFSAGFAVAVLQAMGMSTLQFGKALRVYKARR